MTGYTFPQLIDFTRTSAATFVNSSGNIASTPQSRNLLTFTQEFTNAAWTKTASTVTANVTAAPDGTMTADKAIATAAAGYHVVRATVNPGTAAVNTFSIYAKAAEYTRVHLGNISTTTWGAAFDLSNGTVIATYGSGITPSITSVGNGWYRCSVTFSGAASGWSYGVIGYPAGATLDAAGAQYTGDGVSGIFIWGAQLEFVPDASLTLGSEVVTVNSATLTGSTGYTAITGNTVVAQATYYVTYTASLSAGQIQAEVGGTLLSSVSTSGTYTAVIVAATTAAPRFYSSAGVGSISNFSVKRITGTVGYPTDYTRNFGGLFPPRFDYDPVTRAPRGLLIEEQRTNLLVRSEEFDNASWSKTNATVTANATTSPDGTADADRLADDATNGLHFTGQTVTLAATTYAISFYAKADTLSRVLIRENSVTGNNASFDLSNGTVLQSSGVTATITNAGNGWYRCTIIQTIGTPGATQYGIFTLPAGGSTYANATYAGTGQSLFIHGAQLEAGAFATSYIPTVASQVTRSADVAAINAPNFASWFNGVEGTLLVSASVLGSPGAATVSFAQLSNGSSNNFEISLGMFDFSAPSFQVVNSTTQANLDLGSMTAGQIVNMAGAYKANDFAGVLNGGTVQTDASGSIPSGISTLGIGFRLGGVYMNGHIRSIRYYPTRLSNAQLQALTA